MAVIAVAGGTSLTLGRSIVTAIAATSNTPVILSRKQDGKPQPKSCHGAEVRYVDYSSHDSLVKVLHDVQTVISVLKVPGPEWYTYQANLVKAAQASPTTKRFAPAEFSSGPEADGRIDLVAAKLSVWADCQKATDLECARFSNGMFMNYLAYDSPLFDNDAAKRDKVLRGLEDMSVIWNLRQMTADVPVKDDGTAPRVTLTEITDIGRFVAAACELPLGSWKSSMEMAGETISLDEITEILENALGKKFKVKRVPAQEWRARADAIDGIGKDRNEMVDKMLSQIMLCDIEEKEGMHICRPVVNSLCPAVKPTTVRDFVKMAYS